MQVGCNAGRLTAHNAPFSHIEMEIDMATKKATRKSSKKTAKKSAAKQSARKSTRKYGSSAAKHVKTEMHEMKRGKLKSGRSGKKVTSRKQAIAIGLSEARKEGAKVPRKKS